MRIEVYNGEYTFVFENSRLSVLHYGKPWRLTDAIQGERAIVGLMRKFKELRETTESKDLFEELFKIHVDPSTNKVSISYDFLKALRERHADDCRRMAELEMLLIVQKEHLLETAATVAWNVYMDTCKKNGIGPAGWEHWCAASKIRELKNVI